MLPRRPYDEPHLDDPFWWFVLIGLLVVLVYGLVTGDGGAADFIHD